VNEAVNKRSGSLVLLRLAILLLSLGIAQRSYGGVEQQGLRCCRGLFPWRRRLVGGDSAPDGSRAQTSGQRSRTLSSGFFGLIAKATRKNAIKKLVELKVPIKALAHKKDARSEQLLLCLINGSNIFDRAIDFGGSLGPAEDAWIVVQGRQDGDEPTCSIVGINVFHGTGRPHYGQRRHAPGKSHPALRRLPNTCRNCEVFFHVCCERAKSCAATFHALSTSRW
jgi:hypothetical protein